MSRKEAARARGRSRPEVRGALQRWGLDAIGATVSKLLLVTRPFTRYMLSDDFFLLGPTFVQSVKCLSLVWSSRTGAHLSLVRGQHTLAFRELHCEGRCCRRQQVRASTSRWWNLATSPLWHSPGPPSPPGPRSLLPVPLDLQCPLQRWPLESLNWMHRHIPDEYYSSSHDFAEDYVFPSSPPSMTSWRPLRSARVPKGEPWGIPGRSSRHASILTPHA